MRRRADVVALVGGEWEGDLQVAAWQSGTVAR